jgi:chromate transporter
MLGVAAAAFLALFAFAVPFPVVVLVAGLLGYMAARAWPGLFAGGGQKSATASYGPAVIDADAADVTPSAGRAVRIIAAWGLLWLAPLVLIVPLLGLKGALTDIFIFFSQMAVVTFGGAYAVLAYVAQEAVQTFGWLNPGEMIDGLALAETTPGPLVLVLTFVGFMAAYRAPLGLDPLWAGVLGATLTTWVTFVPCFLWIFLGAPYVERLRQNRALSGALATITAAVVGVILNLALWFALHVVFGRVGAFSLGPLRMPLPAWQTLDPTALALAILAAVALFRFKLGLARTLAVFALAGLLLGLFA